ncbi:MAG: hypothetical protein WEF86_02905 [Gemmatimonadota bacterium]
MGTTKQKRTKREGGVNKKGAAEAASNSGQAEPVAMRTPSHGGGKLQCGNPGNKGGRPRNELRALMYDVAVAAAEEALRRLLEPGILQQMTITELTRLLSEATKLAIGQPVKMQVSGSGPDGAIQVAVVGPVSRVLHAS